jgi:hypothetical protein
MWLELTYTPVVAAAAATDANGADRLTEYGWPVAVYLLLLGAACYRLARKLYRYDPPVPPGAENAARPWGFWLAMFGASLILGLLRDWKDIWSAMGPVVRDLWLHVILHRPPESSLSDLITFGLMALFLSMVAMQLLLFFGRRSSLPRVTYIVMAVTLLFSVLPWALSGTTDFPGPEGARSLKVLFVGALWCLYLYRSRRVKATFVRRYAERKEPSAAPVMPPEATPPSAP